MTSSSRELRDEPAPGPQNGPQPGAQRGDQGGGRPDTDTGSGSGSAPGSGPGHEHAGASDAEHAGASGAEHAGASAAELAGVSGAERAAASAEAPSEPGAQPPEGRREAPGDADATAPADPTGASAADRGDGTGSGPAGPSATPVGPAANPAWASARMPRMGIVLLVLGGGWLAVSGAQHLQGIIGPLLLTLNLVIVAYPVQAWLNRLGLPRIVGACASGLIVFAIIIAFFAALGWSMALLVQKIPAYQQQFSALYQSALEQLQRVGVSETQAMSQLQSQLNPSRVVGLATQTLSGLTGALTLLLVVVTIVFVVLIDSMQVGLRLQVASRTHADVAAALVGFARGVRRYWIVSSIFGAIVAVLDVLALVWLGVPLAVVWGLLSFLTNYIPNIGFVIGIVPPTLMALLANGPQSALLVVIAYCVINFVIQSIIQPKFLGDAVGVTATVSLLSLLFWAWVLGPLGALIALPATLLCKALLIDTDPRMQWLNSFIASHPERGNQMEQAGDDVPGRA